MQPGLKPGPTYLPSLIQIWGQILYARRIAFGQRLLRELLSLEVSRSCFWLLGWCSNDVIYSDRAEPRLVGTDGIPVSSIHF